MILTGPFQVSISGVILCLILIQVLPMVSRKTEPSSEGLVVFLTMNTQVGMFS